MVFNTEFSEFEFSGIPLSLNRTGILGGTFNPVHNGHIAMAKIALYEFSLGKVVFIPLGLPPHKKEEYIAPAKDRLEMIKLAIQYEERFSVDTIELYREGFTYTVDTLELLTQQNSGTEYYYIIGADTLFELSKWKRFERVVCLTSFICVLRPGQNDEDVKNYAHSLNDIYGCRFFIARDKGPDISSSQIRESSSSGRLTDGLVPAGVKRYIENNGIYCNE